MEYKKKRDLVSTIKTASLLMYNKEREIWRREEKPRDKQSNMEWEEKKLGTPLSHKPGIFANLGGEHSNNLG